MFAVNDSLVHRFTPIRRLNTEPPLQTQPVNLLWTGGWDSTFQLLRLLFLQRVPVVPYYLINAERPSTGIELLTMKRIKERLFKKNPETQNLLLPTRYYSMMDLQPDQETTAAYEAILANRWLGSQYEWLARFCRQHQVADLHLSIGGIIVGIDHLVTETRIGESVTHAIDSRHASTPEFVLFQHFQLPLFRLPKREMAETVKKQKWDKVMHMTWFCHSPTRGMKPCGRCNPCRTTIEDGLGYRIPWTRRLLGKCFPRKKR